QRDHAWAGVLSAQQPLLDRLVAGAARARRQSLSPLRDRHGRRAAAVVYLCPAVPLGVRQRAAAALDVALADRWGDRVLPLGGGGKAGYPLDACLASGCDSHGGKAGFGVNRRPRRCSTCVRWQGCREAEGATYCGPESGLNRCAARRPASASTRAALRA